MSFLLEVWSGVIKADLTFAETEEVDTMAQDLLSRQNALEKSFKDLEGKKKECENLERALDEAKQDVAVEKERGDDGWASEPSESPTLPNDETISKST